MLPSSSLSKLIFDVTLMGIVTFLFYISISLTTKKECRRFLSVLSCKLQSFLPFCQVCKTLINTLFFTPYIPIKIDVKRIKVCYSK